MIFFRGYHFWEDSNMTSPKILRNPNVIRERYFDLAEIFSKSSTIGEHEILLARRLPVTQLGPG